MVATRRPRRDTAQTVDTALDAALDQRWEAEQAATVHRALTIGLTLTDDDARTLDTTPRVILRLAPSTALFRLLKELARQ